MPEQPNNTPFTDYLITDDEELVPVVMPKWPSVEHKWIQSKYLDSHEEVGFISAEEYYQTQISYWTAILEDFQEGYDEEEKYAREVFKSQTMN